jgi:hypothetical protein
LPGFLLILFFWFLGSISSSYPFPELAGGPWAALQGCCGLSPITRAPGRLENVLSTSATSGT